MPTMSTLTKEEFTKTPTKVLNHQLWLYSMIDGIPHTNQTN